jgi:uncharacterized membrane protein YbhN (UPF0104 family)
VIEDVARARRRRLRWQAAGLVLLAVFLVVFVIANHDDIPEAWRQIRHADVVWLAVAVALSLAAPFTISMVHIASQRSVGLHLDASRGVRLGFVAYFLNLVTKSGGMAGLVPFLVDSNRRGRPRGQTIAAYVLAATLADLAFAVVLFVGVVVVAAQRGLSASEVGATVVFSLLMSGRVIMVIAAMRSRAALRRLYALPHSLRTRVLRRPARPVDHTAADELYDAIQLLWHRPLAALPAVAIAIGYQLVAVALLWAVLGAVHQPHGIDVAIVGYAISMLFAIVGFLPGGLGFVEVSLGAVLVSSGSSLAEATATVALYRMLQLWLPVATGAVIAHRVRAAGDRW